MKVGFCVSTKPSLWPCLWEHPSFLWQSRRWTDTWSYAITPFIWSCTRSALVTLTLRWHGLFRQYSAWCLSQGCTTTTGQSFCLYKNIFRNEVYLTRAIILAAIISTNLVLYATIFRKAHQHIRRLGIATHENTENSRQSGIMLKKLRTAKITGFITLSIHRLFGAFWCFAVQIWHRHKER